MKKTKRRDHYIPQGYPRPSLNARSSLLHTASRIAQTAHAAYADACGIESMRGVMPAGVG